MKTLFTILLFFIGGAALAQSPILVPFGGTRPQDTAYADRSLRVNGMLRFPFYASADTNLVFGIDAAGKIVLRQKGNNTGGGTDTTSLSNRIDQRVKYTDTAAMLTPYATKGNLKDTAAVLRGLITSSIVDTASLSNRINQRVKYTDTAAMLDPYALKSKVFTDSTVLATAINARVKYADTAAMLSPYATKAKVAADSLVQALALLQRVRYTDTTAMLSPYALKSKVAADSTTLAAAINSRVKYTDTSAMLSPYATKANLGDTAAVLRSLIGASGNVNGPAYSTDNAIVRFDGTTGKIIQNSSIVVTDTGAIDLPGRPTQIHNDGQLYYNTDDEALEFQNNEPDIALQIGQENWIRVRNESGATITNGSAVYINGSHTGTGLPTIALAQANSASTTIVAGLATHDIENNTIGYVTSIGAVRGLNTSSFSNGQAVFLSAATPGTLTGTAPSAPNYRFRVGIVTKAASGTAGSIHVTPTTAALGNGTANQVFGMNNAGTLQEVKSIVGASGVSVGNTANTITITAPSKIDSIRRKPGSDSVFWYNNGGTRVFAFRDTSTGGSGLTGSGLTTNYLTKVNTNTSELVNSRIFENSIMAGYGTTDNFKSANPFNFRGFLAVTRDVDHGVLISSNASGYTKVQTYDEPLAINIDGNNVGVGTGSPSYKLDVSGVTRSTNYIVGSAPPSSVVGAGAGSTGSATVDAAGSNHSYQITIVVSGTTATGTIATMTMSSGFTAASSMRPTFSPVNDAAAALSGNQQIKISGTTTTHVLISGTVALLAGTYIWNVNCLPK